VYRLDGSTTTRARHRWGPPDKRHAHRGAALVPVTAPVHLDQCAGTEPGAPAQSAADSIVSLAELFDTATGRRVVLDERTVEALLVGVEQLGGQLAATGMYSAAVPVPADASPLRRLLAALGRRAG
jgi:hypothetical protein